MPACERHFGALALLKIIFYVALASGVAHMFLGAHNTVQLGASGVVFSMIILNSLIGNGKSRSERNSWENSTDVPLSNLFMVLEGSFVPAVFTGKHWDFTYRSPCRRCSGHRHGKDSRRGAPALVDRRRVRAVVRMLSGACRFTCCGATYNEFDFAGLFEFTM